jgi:predicted ATPase/DNA-binding winged helix-turn-helix (wHTH) protein
MARRDEGNRTSSRAPESAVPGSRSHADAGPSGMHHASASGVASFGPFRLRATERLLERDGEALKIGSRALEVLITLVEHAPQVVSKRDLIERAWGSLVVDDGSLRVQVAALRKMLDDGESGAHYITNVPGRGYCFAAPVTWAAALAAPSEATSSRVSAPRLPRRLPRMVGRDDTVQQLARRLREQRFVSIVGAGGIGKTTVALAVAHEVLSEFSGAVYFLDLASLEDPRLVPGALASELGISVASDNPLPAILAFLGEQRVLLLLDSCEHVIEVVAALAENLFCEAPQVHILATSRESLRAEGEQVHHLSPLECPPPSSESVSATQALRFPAVQLFVSQVAASVHTFELTDNDAPVVAEVCRRLDGIALALELAACRVGVYGVRGTASLLDNQFRLLWRGRRTALPRHQTLSATLDWSYNLLTDTERLTLRRLAIFVGPFSLNAVLDVVRENLAPPELTEALAALVEKSLVTPDSAATMHYRLLDTTRSYAWQKLIESGEHLEIERRHCEHVTRALESLGASIWAAPRPENRAYFLSSLSNLRAALEWAFSERGDTALGVRLTAHSACLFFQTSLLPECATWTERAIRSLGAIRGTRLESELQACFALAVMVTKGNVTTARTALTRTLEVAEGLGDAPMQLQILSHGLYRWQLRSGDLRGLSELTARVEAVAKQIDDPYADAMAHDAAATKEFFLGDQRQVPALSRIAPLPGEVNPARISDAPVYSAQFNTSVVQWHARNVSFVLPRSLWLLGSPGEALKMAKKAVQEVNGIDRPSRFCYMLMSVILVFLEIGDLKSAEDSIDCVLHWTARDSLLTYSRAAVGWQGWLAVLRGDSSRGIESLRTAIEALHEDGYELYRPDMSKALAEALLKTGQWDLAYSRVCEAIEWCITRLRTHETCDLLRVRGEILIKKPAPDMREGEACLLSALHLAEQQGLLSLELRSGISLAKLWASQGSARKGIALLGSIYHRFPVGSESRDLIEAANLLDELRSRS